MAGFKWLFVGIDLGEMAVVTRDDWYSDDDPRAWTVQSYTPGQKPEEWKQITGERADRIVDACRTQKCDHHINWTDSAAILDLYWEFKE